MVACPARRPTCAPRKTERRPSSLPFSEADARLSPLWELLTAIAGCTLLGCKILGSCGSNQVYSTDSMLAQLHVCSCAPRHNWGDQWPRRLPGVFSHMMKGDSLIE